MKRLNVTCTLKYLEDFQNGADLASYNYVKSMNLFT